MLGDEHDAEFASNAKERTVETREHAVELAARYVVALGHMYRALGSLPAEDDAADHDMEAASCTFEEPWTGRAMDALREAGIDVQDGFEYAFAQLPAAEWKGDEWKEQCSVCYSESSDDARPISKEELELLEQIYAKSKTL